MKHRHGNHLSVDRVTSSRAFPPSVSIIAKPGQKLSVFVDCETFKERRANVVKCGITRAGTEPFINFTGTKTHYSAINLKMRWHKMSDVEEAIKRKWLQCPLPNSVPNEASLT